MDAESKLRGLRTLSIVVTVLSLVLLLAGFAQIALGSVTVGEHYDYVEEHTEQVRTYNPYYTPPPEVQAYNESGMAFIDNQFFRVATGETSLGESPFVLATLGVILLAILFFIASLVWVYRAHLNLTEHGVRMKHGPRKAVANFLIPVANFVLPIEAMRELWNRSHGESEDMALTPVDEITAWWSAQIIGLLLLIGVTVKFVLGKATNVIVYTGAWMEFVVISFALLLLFISTVLFAGMVRRITAAQKENLAHTQPDAVEEARPRGVTIR